jgi:hypothetical protein
VSVWLSGINAATISENIVSRKREHGENSLSLIHVKGVCGSRERDLLRNYDTFISRVAMLIVCILCCEGLSLSLAVSNVVLIMSTKAREREEKKIKNSINAPRWRRLKLMINIRLISSNS